MYSSPLLYNSDSDGLNDYYESLYLTDPTSADTDSDGVWDDYEVEANTLPFGVESKDPILMDVSSQYEYVTFLSIPIKIEMDTNIIIEDCSYFNYYSLSNSLFSEVSDINSNSLHFSMDFTSEKVISSILKGISVKNSIVSNSGIIWELYFDSMTLFNGLIGKFEYIFNRISNIPYILAEKWDNYGKEMLTEYLSNSIDDDIDNVQNILNYICNRITLVEENFNNLKVFVNGDLFKDNNEVLSDFVTLLYRIASAEMIRKTFNIDFYDGFSIYLEDYIHPLFSNVYIHVGDEIYISSLCKESLKKVKEYLTISIGILMDVPEEILSFRFEESPIYGTVTLNEVTRALSIGGITAVIVYAAWNIFLMLLGLYIQQKIKESYGPGPAFLFSIGWLILSKIVGAPFAGFLFVTASIGIIVYDAFNFNKDLEEFSTDAEADINKDLSEEWIKGKSGDEDDDHVIELYDVNDKVDLWLVIKIDYFKTSYKYDKITSSHIPIYVGIEHYGHPYGKLAFWNENDYVFTKDRLETNYQFMITSPPDQPVYANEIYTGQPSYYRMNVHTDENEYIYIDVNDLRCYKGSVDNYWLDILIGFFEYDDESGRPIEEGGTKAYNLNGKNDYVRIRINIGDVTQEYHSYSNSGGFNRYIRGSSSKGVGEIGYSYFLLNNTYMPDNPLYELIPPDDIRTSKEVFDNPYDVE